MIPKTITGQASAIRVRVTGAVGSDVLTVPAARGRISQPPWLNTSTPGKLNPQLPANEPRASGAIPGVYELADESPSDTKCHPAACGHPPQVMTSKFPRSTITTADPGPGVPAHA